MTAHHMVSSKHAGAITRICEPTITTLLAARNIVVKIIAIIVDASEYLFVIHHKVAG